jgi:hypothetical protein
MSVLVTVHATEGKAFGPYSVSARALELPTTLADYEREGLACAREDGLPEAHVAGCTYTVTFPKEEPGAGSQQSSQVDGSGSPPAGIW